jgi:hypothetical protein
VAIAFKLGDTNLNYKNYKIKNEENKNNNNRNDSFGM